MKKFHYITVNDLYNGVYKSQVIEVVNHLEEEFSITIKLIAFVPLKRFFSQRKLIKSKKSSAKVYPIMGKLSSFRRGRFFLAFNTKKTVAICRGPLAFVLAKSLYSKVVYDGRAAVAAEVEEYDITGSSLLNDIFINCEMKAISSADYYIAVSSKLVHYWENKLSQVIPLKKYSVIPCTLNAQKSRFKKTGEPIKIVYSGGVAGWQSFDKVVKMVRQAMEKQENIDVLFLCKKVQEIDVLLNDYPDRCEQKWVAPDKVFEELKACDYGILLREDKLTNRVASPVKFAEYLNAGLMVLISDGIGDFSDFVREHNCGQIVENYLPQLSGVSESEKLKNNSICRKYFDKKTELVNQQYQKLIKFFEFSS
jgi:hypothetical protein